MVAEEVTHWYNLDDYAQEQRTVGYKVSKRCQHYIEKEIRSRPTDRPGTRPSPISVRDKVYIKAIVKPGLHKKVQQL